MYVLGQVEALENMAQAAKAQKGPVATANSKPKTNAQGMPIFDPSFTINWDAWTPGNEAAAALLDEPGGLKDLLGEIDIQARGIADYSHDLLGRALADGIARGDTPVTIANDIRDSLSAPERALTIAITEGQRAKISANLDSYQANNVEQIEWTVNDPDDADCLDNEGQIVNLGDEFASGDTQPPVHPNCQCDVIPVMPDLSGTPEYTDEPVDDGSGDSSDDSEMAVAPDLAKYNPDQERDSHGRFGSGGGSSSTSSGGKYPAISSGGNGYSVTEMHYNNAKSDSLVNKVYDAEHSVREGQQVVRGTLEKPTAPEYPKEALVQARNEGNAGEAMRLSWEYQKQYEAYSRAFDKYQKDFKVQNLQSDLAKNTLDGSKAGVASYINNVINQDWFKEAYGDGGKIGQPDVTVRSVKSYAGQYTSGLTKNEISISSSYTQNEPTILHEIAHYAQTISSTVKYEAHGVGFARTNLHITENVM
jgi:SPP1 gp7 family putative phage head morphogenesis protein